MPQARHTRLDRSPGCSVEAAVSLIDGKWTCVILFQLGRGALRFNEVRRRVPGVTQRMLTNQLREIGADGLIQRRVYAEVPPKVEYSLPPLGRSMEPVLAALKERGDANIGLFARPGNAPRDEIAAAA